MCNYYVNEQQLSYFRNITFKLLQRNFAIKQEMHVNKYVYVCQWHYIFKKVLEKNENTTAPSKF